MHAIQKTILLVAFSSASFSGFAKEPGCGVDEKVIVAKLFWGVNPHCIYEKPDVESTLRTTEDTLKLKSNRDGLTAGQPLAAVALDRMNILYAGIDNPVSVAATGAGADKLMVTINTGTLTMVGPGKFIVRVSSVTDNCIISVFVDEKIVSSSQFRVRHLPAPTAAVGGNTSGDSLAAGAFAVQAGVGCYLKDFPFEVAYQITGYTLAIHAASGGIKSISNTGAAFSP